MKGESEPIPVFGQDFEQLQMFLRDEGGTISPERFARVFNLDLKTLATAAHVSTEKLSKTPNDEHVQRYLRDSVQITCAAADVADSVERALLWFKNAPIQPFDDMTGQELASAGRTDDLLRYIHSLHAGFSG